MLAADICGKPRLAARELTNNDTTGQKSIDKYGNLELAWNTIEILPTTDSCLGTWHASAIYVQKLGVIDFH